MFKAPIDLRKPLAENIVVIGGTALLKGFKHRLLSEVRHLSSTPYYKNLLSVNKFKIHTPLAKENYIAFLGGK